MYLCYRLLARFIPTPFRRKTGRYAKRGLNTYRGLPVWQKRAGHLGLAALVILPSFLWLSQAYAMTQGPLAPTSGVDNAGVGTVAWTSPGNVTAQDSVYATQSLGSTVVGHYLVATGFGFTIPTGSTINGITAIVWRTGTVSAGKAQIQDNAIRIVQGGTVQTTDRSSTTAWPTTNTSASYGSSTDLWGATWTVAQINASNFGLAVSAKNVKLGGAGATLTASLDYVALTVYYTPPPTLASQNSYRLYNNADASTQSTYVTLSDAPASSSSGEGFGIVGSSDGGYVVAGQTNDIGAGGNDAYIAKYDSGSKLVWFKTWGSANAEAFYAIAATPDGGYAAVGTSGTADSLGDILTAKFDSTGNLLWSRNWGKAAAQDNGRAVAAQTDGSIYVAGSTLLSGGSAILKYDSTGTLLWSYTWGTSSSSYGVAATSDGGCIVSAYDNSGLYIIKISSTGTLSWAQTLVASLGSSGFADGLIQTSDGGYAQTGKTGNGQYVAKMTSTGSISWVTQISTGTNNDTGKALIQTSDGGYAVAGIANSLVSLVKLSSAGSVSWSKTLGGGGGEGDSVIQTAGGGYAVSGFSTTWTTGNNGAILAAFDANGSIANCSTNCPAYSPTASSLSWTASTNATGLASATSTTTNTAGTSSAGTPREVSYIGLSPSIDVGTALAAQNTAATVPNNGQFRMRLDLAISNYQLDPAAGTAYKLQYAKRGTDNSCDTSFTGETYDYVGSNTPISYYDNPNAVNGQSMATNANDPTDGTNTLVRQSYQEAGTTNFAPTTITPTGQDAMWDFALKLGQNAYGGEHYCLRVVDSSGTVINAYTTVPEVIVPPSVLTQGNSRVFNQETSAGGANTFIKAWGGTSDDFGYSMVQTSDGGYAVTGKTTSFGTNMFLAKYDSSGNLTWNTTWGGGNDNGNSLVQTSDGGYAVTGQTNSYGAGSGDMFLAKYDSSGTLSWSRTWGGTSPDTGRSVVQTSDGGYAVTGDTASFGAGSPDVFLAKYDSSGTLSWSRTWGGTGTDYGFSVIQTSDSGYAITGSTTSFDGSVSDMFLLKYDSSGTLSWNKAWGNSSYSDTGYSLIQTSDGGYAVTGDTGMGAGSYDMLLAKYDSSGNLSWSRTWGGTAEDHGYSLVQTSDGGYAVTGQTNSYGAGSGDMLLAKYDSSGTLGWSRTWGGTGLDAGKSIVQTSDGGYAVTGYTPSFGAGFNDMFLAKYDSSGYISGCSSTACTTPLATTGSQSATSSPAATTSAPTATTSAPTATTSSPTATATNVVSATAEANIGPVAATQNGVYVPRSGTPFRLRMAIGVSASSAAAAGLSLKLQYAVRGSDNQCDTSFTGETYADVTTSTPIQFYNDTNYATGAPLYTSTSDITDGTALVLLQQFVEANNFSNNVPIYYGQDGAWDFSLTMAPGTSIGTAFCLRMVNSTGSVLDAYTNIPELQYGAATPQRLRGGKFFDSRGSLQGLFLP